MSADQSDGWTPIRYLELETMGQINNLLERFDNKTRRRMLEWVIAFQAEIPVACIPEPSRGDDR